MVLQMQTGLEQARRSCREENDAQQAPYSPPCYDAISLKSIDVHK